MPNTDCMPERWLPVPGYESSYEVSDLGRVRSLDRVIHYSNGRGSRVHRGTMLKVRKAKGQNGYMQAILAKGSEPRYFSVHRLVLLAFVGPCPEGMEACHNNDIPDDNRLSNLRWDTHRSNINDRVVRESLAGGRTHCKRGHEFTAENTYFRSKTRRECKACRSVHMANFRTARRIVAAAASVIVFGGTAIGYASGRAAADPGIGCETIHWGFLGGQRRTVCDTPRRPDGSWTRAREVWVPAGYVPGSTYCGTYSCTSSGGYYRERGTVAYEQYPVTDATVLPDEPGWLPSGSVVIR